MTDRFRMSDKGVPQRLNSEGFWIGPTDPAQPNPAYEPNPGIHGWDGVQRVDIALDAVPGDEVEIPSLAIPEIIPEAGQIPGQSSRERSFQVGSASTDIPVTKVGPHVIF